MTIKEERIQELWLKIAELERFIKYEEYTIEITERKLLETETRLKRLESQKKQAENRINEYAVLLRATQARLEAHNQG
jgi:hypothetical protein